MNLHLLTTGLFPHEIGGIQKHSSILMEEMRKRGWEVNVFHSGKAEEDPFQPAPGIESYYLPFPKSQFPFPGHYLWENWTYSKWIAERIEALPPADLIYAQGFAAWAWLMAREKTSDRTPVLVNFHGLNMFQLPPNRRQAVAGALFRPFVRSIVRRADVVQSLGGGLTDILLRQGVSKAKIRVIPIGIQQDWLAESWPGTGSVQKWVFVGRYERLKGIEELFGAIRRLPAAAKFELHMVGPVPEDKRLRDGRILYHGLVTDMATLKGLLVASDVILCPSISEGMPTVILEAMASGCAVVATRVGAVEEVVDQQVGWLLAPGEVGELTAVLNQVLHTPAASIDKMKSVARKRVEAGFTWERIADFMSDTFEQICEQARSRTYR